MISKTKIKKRMKKKTNPELVETIKSAEKNNLLELGKRLSVPTKKQIKINLSQLDKVKEKNIMVIGKVLGEGEINDKKSIFALSFSKPAKEKLKKAGCKINTIKQEINNNPKLKDVKII